GDSPVCSRRTKCARCGMRPPRASGKNDRRRRLARQSTARNGRPRPAARRPERPLAGAGRGRREDRHGGSAAAPDPRRPRSRDRHWPECGLHSAVGEGAGPRSMTHAASAKTPAGVGRKLLLWGGLGLLLLAIAIAVGLTSGYAGIPATLVARILWLRVVAPRAVQA